MGEKKMGVKNRVRYSAKCFILFGFGQEFSFWCTPKNKKNQWYEWQFHFLWPWRRQLRFLFALNKSFQIRLFFLVLHLSTTNIL